MAAQKRTRELDTQERKAMSSKEYAFPRLRKEPLNDASHVRNAIARFDQVRDATDDERQQAFSRIRRAADKFGIEVSERRWQDLGKPSATMRSSDKPRRPTKAQHPTGPSRSRDDLYAEAQRRKIPGRSHMTKDELLRALSA